jgi:sulfoxide reductase catalytic subunit YedY
LNALKDITTYNNFYELGTDKGDPAENAKYLTTRPWTVVVEGEVKKPKTYDVDALTKLAPLEERIYRLRCVEAWSMVVPWVGFPLSSLIKLAEPTGNAKYIQFVTLQDPSACRAKFPCWNGPTSKAAHDEAMHPLTILSVGSTAKRCRRKTERRSGWSCRGNTVSKDQIHRQDPLRRETTARLGPCSRRIRFLFQCKPEVDHPRWSQATERRIGEFLGGRP